MSAPVESLASQLEALGLELPTPRAERWKYTPLRALAARRFRPARDTDRAPVDPLALGSIPAPRLVYVNGQFHDALSDVSSLPSGVSLRDSRVVPGAPDAAAAGTQDAFLHLNAAFASGGAYLEVQSHVRVGIPLHLVFVSSPADVDLGVHARHEVVLGEGAHACVVEHHLAAGAHSHLVNHVLDLDVGPGAELAHVRVQDEHVGAHLFAATHATVDEGGTYRRVDLELGAGLSRHELDVALAGERARLESGGVLLASGRRHLDVRLKVVHAARDTACELTWRGVAAGRAKAVFHGGILIQAGADGAAAALSSKNLLLSDQAEIDAQPVLEIHADEVAASHGATVGRLDPAHLFYLRSRGIDPAQARAILTAAFGRQALAPLGASPLVEPLAERLRERLAALDAA